MEGYDGPVEAGAEPLPYLDNDYDEPEMRDYVDSLVAEEMSAFVPRDYLARLPDPGEPTFGGSEALRSMYADVAASGEVTKAPVEEVTVLAPTGKARGDPVAWQEALDSARVQFAHLQTQVENLELMQQFGGNAWRHHNISKSKLLASLKRQLENIRERVEQINSTRKSELEPHGPQLKALTRKWAEAAENNLQLELACAQLESSVKRLRREAAAKGVEVPAEGAEEPSAMAVGGAAIALD